MNSTYQLLEYTNILQILSEKAVSNEAKEQCLNLEPYLSELELRKEMRNTTQARLLIDSLGNPPLPIMEHIKEFLDSCVKGELLSPEDIFSVCSFLISVERMQQYLKKGCSHEISLSFYCDNLNSLVTLQEEIKRSIRNGMVDDYATALLRDIRKKITILEEKIKAKADAIIKANKSYMAENFVVTRNGKVCVPVKKDMKHKIPGTVIDFFSSGSTIFIEPISITKLQEELDLLKIDEDNEERRILYTLVSMISDEELTLRENIRTILLLDFIFAKGKLSIEMDGKEPSINTEHYIHITQGRHPFLLKDTCVPLDFEIGFTKNNLKERGMIITGPNTGGKTVTIKTVGLFCLMACSGLHLPCLKADICMNNLVLCDIGDGQNIKDNLSTFSSHITNVLAILQQVTKESLVIMDELGSGTDPAEGMGIAIAILEQLRKSECLFLVTTHYPEVKTYAEDRNDIINARMGFDRNNLKPLYHLEIGKSGESCALYIAKRLGIPDDMILYAKRKAYGENTDDLDKDNEFSHNLFKKAAPHIIRNSVKENPKDKAINFCRGDSVTIMPDNIIGIVINPANDDGNVLVQIRKEQKLINHKRLKLKIAASSLYPDDYDFSVIFDTVANRKARHQLEKGHWEGYEIKVNDKIK